MAEDVKEGIVKVVVDRVANPLLFGFAISWCFINYQFFVLVLKVADYSKLASVLKGDLFSDVKNYQFFGVDVSICTYHGLLLPAWLSFLYVTLSPVVMLGVTWWQLYCESILRKIKNKFDDNFSRTREEFARLENNLKEVTNQKEELDLKNSSLRSRYESVVKDRDNLEAEKGKFLELLNGNQADADKKLAEAHDKISELNQKINAGADGLSTFVENKHFSGVGSNGVERVSDLSMFYEDVKFKFPSLGLMYAQKVFEELIRTGGGLRKDQLDIKDISRLKIESAIDNLMQDGLLVIQNGRYNFSETGRKIAITIEDLM